MADVLVLGLAPQHFAGAVLQSVALAVVDNGDVNTSYTTRAIGTLMVALLLALGTFIAAAPPLRIFSLLVPVVRADLVFLVVIRLIRSLIWASRLAPNSILYENETFPIQAAAMIWNDCQPIKPHTAVEDEHSIFVDWLYTQRDLWRPTQFDSVIARSLKFPIFTLLQILALSVSALEFAISRAWKAFFNGRTRNAFPVQIRGAFPEVIGHTMLISDKHLTWVQRFTMQRENIAQSKEARRVALRALHCASLLVHGGHTRLHEAGPGGYAMSEYYAAIVGNDIVKMLLSKSDELQIFPKLPNGNQTTRGQVIPRQVLWARLIAGSLAGLRGEGRWRGPVAISLFKVAQANVQQLGPSVNRSAIQRHVYSVMRRLLVNWMMYIWWEIGVPADIVNDPDALFERLVKLLTKSIVHNTTSLPHAVGELAVSTQRENDVNNMLRLMLGEDWEIWTQQAVVANGSNLFSAMAQSGEWKCLGRPVEAAISVDSGLYGQMPLEDAMVASAADPPARQARAVLANRLVDTLANRLRGVWLQEPRRLIDPAVMQPNEEY